MKNLDVKNIDAFKSDKNLRLSRRPLAGILISCLIMGLFYSQFYDKGGNNYGETIVITAEQSAMDVSLEQVNALNIIINDSNCSDTFIKGIVEELSNDGIKFALTSDEKNIDVDNAVVISLDQQYISGPGTLVLAPFENGRLGNSDALALSMNAGFYESGFFTEDIQCGKLGYMQLDDGTVVERIPTETETNIGTDKNTSFVTICFGTQNTNSKLVAQAIERSLARYAYFINNEKTDLDLVLRIESGEEENLNSAEVNPITMVLRAFNEKMPVVLGDVEKTIWYK